MHVVPYAELNYKQILTFFLLADLPGTLGWRYLNGGISQLRSIERFPNSAPSGWGWSMSGNANTSGLLL